MTLAIQLGRQPAGPCAATGMWLMQEARECPTTADLVGELGRRLVEDGLPISRFMVSVRTLHPQVAASNYQWRRGQERATEATRLHGILETTAYLDSPLKLINDGAPEVRRRIEGAEAPLDFPILQELAAEGATDYIALPVLFSRGVLIAATMASDRPGGFSDAEIEDFKLLLPLLALVIEAKETWRMAGTLLETYLGADAGRRVLAGAVQRGDVVAIAAALWYCDLRGFTAMSERLPREAVIALLNDYFACMAGPVKAHGGEVLKFIGDAMLAIFPMADDLDRDRACLAALAAGEEALLQLDRMNERRRAVEAAALEVGLALHAGTVMYGNIGAPDRLDFTIIGPAVNMVTRLERLCQPLGRRLLASARFASPCGSKLVSLGRHELRDIAQLQEVFTLPG